MVLIIVLLIVAIGLLLLKKWLRGAVCKNKHDMKDQFVIITGASSGLGKEAAKDLIMQGAKVVYACRSEKNALVAINELPEKHRSQASFLQLDLCSYVSIQAFASKIKKEYPLINILINNAGAHPFDFIVTKDNCESFVQGNHLGPMVLTFLLLDHFALSQSRIINISGLAYVFANLSIEKMKHYDTPEQIRAYYFGSFMGLWEYYSVCKLMNLYFTQYLADVLPTKYSYIKTVALHPGVVNSPFLRFVQRNKFLSAFFYLTTPLMKFFCKNVSEGVQTHLHLCYCKYEELVSGAYYSECGVGSLSAIGKNKDLRKAVIDWSIAKIKEKVPSFDL